MRHLVVLVVLCGCPPPILGSPCSASSPCGAGTLNTSYTCDLTQPGGSCTRPCTVEGDVSTVCSFSGDHRDGICARFANDGGLQCALECGASGATCRTGYRCATIADAGLGCVP